MTKYFSFPLCMIYSLCLILIITTSLNIGNKTDGVIGWDDLIINLMIIGFSFSCGYTHRMVKE